MHQDLASHIDNSVIDYGTNRRGLRILRRRWSPTGDPRAVVLLLHGIGEHTGRYEHVGRRLADAGFGVVAHDHQGFGESGGTRAFVESFEWYLDDVEDQMATVRELGLPVILLGHSMGGLIGAAYAMSDRPQPDLCVFSAPALGAEVPDWQRKWAPRLSRWLPSLFIPNPLDGTILSRDPDVGAAYAADPLIRPGGTTRLGHELFQAMNVTRANVHMIPMPTWVGHGTADRLVPIEASDPFDKMETATRVTYPGLRHELFNEPEGPAVLDDVVEWIDQQLATLPVSSGAG